MAIDFPDLPYALDALEPHVSKETLSFHYGKHHKGYVDKLNKALPGTAYEDQPLDVIIAAAREADDSGVFNNAAQIWNHTFLWHSMSPDGGGKPSGALAAALDERFGNLDAFRSAFRSAALGQFGSGWAWLVKTPEGLDVVNTGNAELPFGDGIVPLLTLDVWEHAYYLDYQNGRAAYVDTFLDKLINYEFAAANFESD